MRIKKARNVVRKNPIKNLGAYAHEAKLPKAESVRTIGKKPKSTVASSTIKRTTKRIVKEMRAQKGVHLNDY